MGDWRNWLLWGLPGAILGCLAVLTPHCVDDQRERHSVTVASELKAEYRQVRECHRLGGLWTPVGGVGYHSRSVIYGCVFPSRSP